MPDMRAAITQQLAPYAAHLTGNPLALALCIKGDKGAAEAAGGPPLSGADGAALAKAADTLGWGSDGWCGLLLAGASAGADGADAIDASTLALIIEIVDPQVVVALDESARQALILAYAKSEPALRGQLKAGAQARVLGRTLASVPDFEGALADPERKQRAWQQLKAARLPS
jgi:hypothetical protein